MSLINKWIEYIEWYDEKKRLKGEEYDYNVKRILNYISHTWILVIIVDISISLLVFAFLFYYFKL